MRVCITGGAGFIGSHVTRRALGRGWLVTVLDNFLTGRREFLPDNDYRNWALCQAGYVSPLGLEIIEGSVHGHDDLIRAIDGCDWVIHMAANAEGRRGLVRPTWDIEQNVLGTSRVLEAMRAVGCDRIFYASSGSVYGNARATLDDPIREDAPFPTQTSLYGASKVAGEGLVAAYVEGHGYTGVIGRWMQAIGEHYLHGHVIDFVRKLRRDPTKLEILGRLDASKSGLYVGDLAEGILTTVEHHDSAGGLGVYNFGTETSFTILDSARLIAETMGVKPQFLFDGDTWPGDSPVCHLDSSKARGLGWKPELTVQEAVVRAVEYLTKEARYL